MIRSLWKNIFWIQAGQNIGPGILAQTGQQQSNYQHACTRTKIKQISRWPVSPGFKIRTENNLFPAAMSTERNRALRSWLKFSP